MPSPGDGDPGARGVGAVPALQAGLGLRRRGNWQRPAGTAATGGSPRSPPCQGRVGGLAGCGSLSPRLLAGHGRPWDPPSLLVPLQMVLALLTIAHRCLTGWGGSHPAGSSILSLWPSSTHHPTPTWLMAAAKGAPRNGHGCCPELRPVPRFPLPGHVGAVGILAEGWHKPPATPGAAPQQRRQHQGPCHPCLGTQLEQAGTAAGWSPATRGSAPWARQHHGMGAHGDPGWGRW